MWKAWTDPKHVAQWWGPNGFTNTIREMNVKPDGVWRFIMHDPDGVDYKNEIVFIEVVEPERLVYDHVSGPKFKVRVAFDERDGKTKVTFRMFFESAAAYDSVKSFVAEANEQNFNRLEMQLAKMA